MIAERAQKGGASRILHQAVARLLRGGDKIPRKAGYPAGTQRTHGTGARVDAHDGVSLRVKAGEEGEQTARKRALGARAGSVAHEQRQRRAARAVNGLGELRHALRMMAETGCDGVVIGRATADIPAGSWVHLHVMCSNYDDRSSHLDVVTGAPKDIRYE